MKAHAVWYITLSGLLALVAWVAFTRFTQFPEQQAESINDLDTLKKKWCDESSCVKKSVTQTINELHAVTCLSRLERVQKEKKTWCANFEQVVKNGSIKWEYQNSSSKCPDAMISNCSIITKEDTLDILKGKHILFLGDSVTRYQYLNLASFLSTGNPIWPTSPSSEVEKEWPSWTAFYQGTNRRMNGQEVCDCFRSPIFNPHLIVENRYWFGQNGIRVTYL